MEFGVVGDLLEYGPVYGLTLAVNCFACIGYCLFVLVCFDPCIQHVHKFIVFRQTLSMDDQGLNI